MSEKERLLDTLFSNEKREHLNIKFFRTYSDNDITVETFCAAVNKAIFLVDNGLIEGNNSFPEDMKRIEVRSLFA